MKTYNFASLISGGGSTMASAVDAVQNGELNSKTGDVNMVGVIASKSDAKGIERARKLGVPTFVVERKLCADREEFGRKIMEILDKVGAEYVFQNGWLPLTPQIVIDNYKGKIFNQHPCSTDPDAEENMDFGGKGMHGQAPTCARLAYAWAIQEKNPVTESTVHHLSTDGKYDRGQIIRVEPMFIEKSPFPVAIDDSPLTIGDLENNKLLHTLLTDTTEKVQKALLPLEHKNVQEVIRHIAENGVPPSFKRTQRLIPPEHKDILSRAKALAVRLFPNG